MRRHQSLEQLIRADDRHVLHGRRLRVPLLEVFQHLRVLGKREQRVLLTGLHLQEGKDCDAIAEPGHAVVDVRLCLLERPDDLFSGCLRVSDVLSLILARIINTFIDRFPSVPDGLSHLGDERALAEGTARFRALRTAASGTAARGS